MQLPRERGLSRRLAYGEYIRNFLGSRGYTEAHVPRDTHNVISLKVLNKGLSLKIVLLNSKVFCKEEFLCCICQDTFSQNIIRELSCKHSFHINCIDTWLANNATCPMCRKIIGENN